MTRICEILDDSKINQDLSIDMWIAAIQVSYMFGLLEGDDLCQRCDQAEKIVKASEEDYAEKSYHSLSKICELNLIKFAINTRSGKYEQAKTIWYEKINATRTQAIGIAGKYSEQERICFEFESITDYFMLLQTLKIQKKIEEGCKISKEVKILISNFKKNPNWQEQSNP